MEALNDFYVFATYNGARVVSLEYGNSFDEVSIIIKRNDLRLEIYARKEKSAELASPVMGTMDGRINESMDSVIRISLKKADRIIIDDKGVCGGFEMINPGLL